MVDIKYTLTSGRLLVELPRKMKFGFDFLYAMNEFLEIASTSPVKKVCVACEKDADKGIYLYCTEVFAAFKKNFMESRTFIYDLA